MNNDARIDYVASVTCIVNGGLKKIDLCLEQCPVVDLPVRVVIAPRFTDNAVPINSDLSLEVTVPASREGRTAATPSVNVWDLTNILRKLLNDSGLTIVDTMSRGISLSNGRPYMREGSHYESHEEVYLEE